MTLSAIVHSNFEPKFNVRIFKRDFLKMCAASYGTVCDLTDYNYDVAIRKKKFENLLTGNL